jgi:pyruvate carboxylase subunit B
MGYPPLVTPTSQIVGTQATLNVITGERYKVITNETRNYVKGLYGRPPGNISAELRKRALRSGKAITSRPADRLKPELKKLRAALAGTTSSLEDILSYALFPNVAAEFFEQRAKGELKPEPIDPENGDDTASDEHKRLAPREFNVTLHGESYRIEVTGASHKTEGQKPYYIRINDQLEEVYLEPISEVLPGAPQASESQANLPFARPKPQHPGDVTSPMPGKVVKVLVQEGAQVKKGAIVLIIEAMKMESQVVSPIAGTVAKVNVSLGDDIKTEETLIVVE